MRKWPGNAKCTAVMAVAVGTAATLAAAGCSSGSNSAGKQVSASARQTIVFATQGLGAEGTATTAAVKAFEKDLGLG